MARLFPSLSRIICFFIAVSVMVSEASCFRENGGANARRPRRLVYWGSMDALQHSTSDSLVVTTSLKNRRRIEDNDCSLMDVARRRKRLKEEEDGDDNDDASSGNKLWPPWPFSLLTQRGSRNNKNGKNDGYRSNGSLFWAYFGQRLLISKRQLQHVGSQLWFHLPPAGAPLILLSCIPQQRAVDINVAGELLVQKAPAFLVNGFIRNLVLASLGLAILSWSNAEVNRNRRMTPLPLPEQYQDIYRAILPHFLPEEVPDVDIEILRSMEQQVNDLPKTTGVEESEAEGLSPRLRRHLQNIYQVAEQKPRTLRTTFREWKRMRELRRLEEAKVRRASIIDELVALQALKKRALERAKSRSTGASSTESRANQPPLGYALVTGSSRGIGRALAVELARWEIPLILVARDIKRLTDLANDIELCYGVKCYVLQADLSENDAAERIHQTTKEAGLDVDFLVCNAGVCSSGLSVDIPNRDIHTMMQINALSVAMLNQLYGRDMKEKGRGRILVVSSVVGSVEAGPTVACYAATKSFERSLAMSMGKELEPYGVGVTCLLPGAVRDTAFQSKSDVDEALCWKLPFYVRQAPQVAHQGVVGLLEGAVQVVPGWQNRAFLKVFKPILPQRLTTVIVEMAWSPFRFSAPRLKLPSLPALRNGKNSTKEKQSRAKAHVEMPTMWPGSTSKSPPRMLKLPEKTTPPEEIAEEPLSTDKSSESVSLDNTQRECVPNGNDVGNTPSSKVITHAPILHEVERPDALKEGRLQQHEKRGEAETMYKTGDDSVLENADNDGRNDASR